MKIKQKGTKSITSEKPTHNLPRFILPVIVRWGRGAIVKAELVVDAGEKDYMVYRFKKGLGPGVKPSSLVWIFLNLPA